MNSLNRTMTNLFNMRPSTNYDYKHNDMKWNIFDYHSHIWRMRMKMMTRYW